MSEENGKLRKPIGVNFAVVTLLLVTIGLTITACANTKSGGESPKPADQSSKQTSKQEKKTQPAKSAKSAKQKDVPQDKIEETTVDDDPE